MAYEAIIEVDVVSDKYPVVHEPHEAVRELGEYRRAADHLGRLAIHNHGGTTSVGFSSDDFASHATLGIRYAYTVSLPRLGVAEVMTALPVLIPLIFILMRKLRMSEGQL